MVFLRRSVWSPWESTCLKRSDAIVAAHRAGTATPAETVARSYRRIRDHNDPAIFIALARRKGCAGRSGGACEKGRERVAALWRAGRGERQYRRRGPCNDRRLPRLLVYAGAGCDCGGAIARGRRHRHRQDQSRPVRNRPRRRALALRHPRQSGPRRSRAGRIEFGIGGGGGGRPRAACARHRHRRQRPRSGDAQQHRRAEAEPWPDLDRGRGAGMPHA